jgi:hypothetical protein
MLNFTPKVLMYFGIKVVGPLNHYFGISANKGMLRASWGVNANPFFFYQYFTIQFLFESI